MMPPVALGRVVAFSFLARQPVFGHCLGIGNVTVLVKKVEADLVVATIQCMYFEGLFLVVSSKTSG